MLSIKLLERPIESFYVSANADL